MKQFLHILIGLFLLSSCTKEVQIEVPGFQEQLVIDGRIETGQAPIVLLSRSKEIYAPTDIDAFLNGFISGAIVTITNSNGTVQLQEVCSDNLPPGTEEIAAAMLGIPADQLANYSICAYTTLDPNFAGIVGETYTLNVTFEGKSYSAVTSIVQPTNLVNSFWQPESGLTNHGYSWATLADLPNQFDAYYWEVKRLNDTLSDFAYQRTYSPTFDDEFFDGLTFEFWYENPFTDDAPDSTRWMYELGDTVVIKLSKLDRDAFEYYEKKYIQLQTAGNPFATPTNIPTNIVGGALGVWAGFSTSYDTLICVP